MRRRRIGAEQHDAGADGAGQQRLRRHRSLRIHLDRHAIPEGFTIDAGLAHRAIECSPYPVLEPDVLDTLGRHRYGLTGDTLVTTALAFRPAMEFLTCQT